MARLGRGQPFRPQRLNAGVVGADTTLQPPLLGSASAQYDATVTVVFSLSAPLLGSTSTQYNATVTPQIALTAPLLSSASALYDASVSATYALTAPLLSSTSAQYNATVTVVAIAVGAPFLDSVSQLFSHTVDDGTASAQPPSHGKRRGFRERKRFYDPDRWLREWQKTEEELRADIEAIEAAQEAAREAAEAKKENKQRKLKVAALERSLKTLDLETEQLRSDLGALKSAAYAEEMAAIQSGLEAMMEDARSAERTLLRLRRDEEAMALLLLAEI